MKIQNGKVYSDEFQDIYFSQEDGAAESDYVFLHGNELYSRFQSLERNETFSIGELGFGTGLNFVLTRRLFLSRADANSFLHYYSFELNLPSPGMARRSVSLFSELREDAKLLRRKLRGVLQKGQGCHTLLFDGGRVRLSLILGDARETIHQMEARCQAWYLDGFAPSRNPQLWQEDLFQLLAKRSEPGATISSFTAAGGVRAALSNAGFSVQRVAGFGRKKHMIRGTLTLASSNAPANKAPDSVTAPREPAPGFHGNPRLSSSRPRLDRGAAIHVVGGGLAGLSTAYALTRRGIPVTLYEAGSIASGASGNRAGMAASALTAEPTAGSLLGLRAQSMFISWAMDQKADWRKLGFVRKREQPERYVRSIESHGLMGARAGKRETLLGWSAAVDPEALCRYYLAESERTGLLTLMEGTKALPADIKNRGDAIFILCNSNDMAEIPECGFIHHRPVRGQVIQLRNPGLVFPLTNQIYLVPCPSNEREAVLGATFDMHLSDPERLPERDLYLLSELEKKLPEVWQGLDEQEKQNLRSDKSIGRVGFRCQSRDYIPVCGPVPDAERFVADNDRFFELPSKEKRHLDMAGINYGVARVPGLFVNSCHGSRGITTSFLAAEILASQLAGEGSPLERELRDALDPVRFLWREVRKPPKDRSF